MSGADEEPIHVLHVDDDAEVAELAATFLERECPAMAVDTAESAEAGLEALEAGSYACVVSDYDMPGDDGLAFLRSVRERHPDLPFVLFTGKGSEEIASEAVSAGVTDYLQKSGDPDQYAVLANRIENAVDHRRTERRLREERRRYELLGRASTDAFWIWDLDSGEVERNDGYTRLFGYAPDEIDATAEWARSRIHPDDRERVIDEIEGTVERGEAVYESSYRFRNADGSYSHVLARGHVDFEDGEPTRLVGAVTDVSDLRRRERELEAVRTRLELVLDGTNTGVWEWDPDSDELTWDETVERLLGVPEEGFDGTYLAFRDRIHEADRDRVERAIERVLDGEERFAEEFRVEHAEGGTRWVAVEGIRWEDPGDGSHRLVGLLRDVTERKEREARLERSERRFEAVFNDPGVFMVLVDPDGRVEAANRQALATIDADQDAVAGTPIAETGWWRKTDRERRAEVQDGIERAAEGEFVHIEALPVEVEDRSITVDGRVRPVTDDDGEVVSVLVEGFDVSDREERERRIEAIHDATGDLVRAADPEAVATVVSEVAADVLGYTSTTVRLVEDGRLRPVVVSDRAQAELGDRPVYDVDEGMPGRAFQKGSPVLIEDFDDLDDFEQTPTPNRSGLYVPLGDHGVLSIGDTEPRVFDRTDVHLAGILASNAAGVLDRLENQESLRARERELARQNERLEKFAGVLAHDLRNPLNVATLSAEALPEDVPGVHRLEAALDRMETLVDDVLVLATQGQTVDDPEPVAVADAAEGAWSTTDTGEAELRVEDAPTVEADPDRLRTLLENLLRNSVEHGSTGSRASADDAIEHGDGPSAEGGPPDAGDAVDAGEVLTRGPGGAPGDGGVTVRIGSLDDGFFVEDDGPGIPADEREQVFEAGYSSAAEGTGFGLAIVSEIAEAHGWRIEATAGRSGGARIEVHTGRGPDAQAS